MAQHAMTIAVDGWRMNLVAAVSLEDARDGAFMDALRATGATVFAFPNAPLAMKWQAGLSVLHNEFPNTDAVMSMGSDDFASPEYVREACRLVDGGEVTPFGKRNIHMFNAETGEIGECPHGNPALTMGAGRVYPRHALDRLHWVLWTSPLQRGLDNAATVRCYEASMHVLVATTDHPVIDVKTTNMNSWDRLESLNMITARHNAEEARNLLEKSGLQSVLRWHAAHLAGVK
jgi:hypothetical protein